MKKLLVVDCVEHVQDNTSSVLSFIKLGLQYKYITPGRSSMPADF